MFYILSYLFPIVLTEGHSDTVLLKFILYLCLLLNILVLPGTNTLANI